MRVNRRSFLKIVGATGTAALVGGPRKARALPPARRSDEMAAVLIDTTRCVGCRSCEMACSRANQLPQPQSSGQASIFDKKRTTSPTAYTVVNRYANPKGGGRPTFVKTQCMHCVDPACASACPAAALQKTPEGPVIYNADRCIGCRYCMGACPFGVPKYEYEKAIPYVRKCSLCFDRLQQGQLPACAAACPMKAIQFGKRGELLETAKTRIYQNPDKYVHHVYGEREAGGTGVMYLSAVPFEELGFPPSLGTKSYLELTSASLSAVPFILTLGPPLLLAIHSFAKNQDEATRHESKDR